MSSTRLIRWLWLCYSCSRIKLLPERRGEEQKWVIAQHSDDLVVIWMPERTSNSTGRYLPHSMLTYYTSILAITKNYRKNVGVLENILWNFVYVMITSMIVWEIHKFGILFLSFIWLWSDATKFCLNVFREDERIVWEKARIFILRILFTVIGFFMTKIRMIMPMVNIHDEIKLSVENERRENHWERSFYTWANKN
jgi:hypothetical protein